ncbi:MAG: hybrid sensor histidine kinase/response regulator [Gammaproteobacteria bacterium]
MSAPAPGGGGAETPAGPDHGVTAAVARTQLEQLYAHVAPGMFIGWILAATFVGLYWRAEQALPIAAWAITFAAWQLLHTWRLRRFRAACRQPLLDTARWLRLNVIGVAGAALLFGAAAWLFYAPDYGELRHVVLVVLLGLLAGAVTVYGHHPPSLYAFHGLLGGLLAGRLAWLHHASSAGLTATLLVVFYVAMLMHFGRRHAHLLRQTLALQFREAELARELVLRSEAVERASLAQARFFAAASHDLRQPLHALGHYAALLDDPTQAVAIGPRIQACVQALEDRFAGVLELARLDAGAVQPQRRAFGLDALCARLRSVHEADAARAGLRLRWRVPAGLALHSDPLLVERILGNLLSNALRYTRRGGVLVAARRRADAVLLCVIDTGPGFDTDALERAFDEFTRLEQPVGEGQAGFGLGLPTVRRLARLLDHELIARSRPGHGSCFGLCVPSADPSRAADTFDDASLSLAGRRVLVVDDDPDARDALARLLARWGLAHDVAADFAAAEALGADTRYDALLCDFHLPGLRNGLDFAIAWRRQQPAARLVCIVSASGPPPGADLPPGIDWLRKPLKPARLRALMSARLRPVASA